MADPTHRRKGTVPEAGAVPSASAHRRRGHRLGGISFLHRFGSALNHHVNLHVCVTDGVFVPAAGEHAAEGCCDANQKPRSHDTSRIAWAKLMVRVGEEFPLECPNYGPSRNRHPQHLSPAGREASTKPPGGRPALTPEKRHARGEGRRFGCRLFGNRRRGTAAGSFRPWRVTWEPGRN